MIFGLGLWAFALCAGPAAHAGDGGVATADSLAMGGAVTADAHASGALLASPATLALEPRYDLYFGARLGGTDDWLLQTEARDSRSGPVALGLAYTRRMANPPPEVGDLPGWRLEGETLENPLTESTIALGAGTSLLDRRLAVGLSGVRYARDTALTESDATYELGFGLASHPVSGLDLAVSALHLVGLARARSSKWPPAPALTVNG